ncbi:hypothetical protein DL762_006070 [Monosporascus cannonballus]|uniref:Uncharacterized protein n=1 Tax=Monosporascus cannonballus TaxID=155416 RepID=A0ABY0H3G9_9PEZI|nr:hypothetical protein DL762_006070 [Monosporascus cannonballus]
MAPPSIQILSRFGSSAAMPPSSSKSRVNALRSQFEFLVNRNTTAPQPPKVEAIPKHDKDDVESEEREEEDACSDYGEADASETAEAFQGSGHSSPEHYVEIAAMNPYGDVHGKDQSQGPEQEGEYFDPPVRQTATLPVRAETMEEAFGRLSHDLESAHRQIEEDQSAALQHFKALALGEGLGDDSD